MTVLVIGYGNPLRSDDGVGWVVAARLAADARLDGARILELHQLAPELALDVSQADLVILVDARADLAAGVVEAGRVAETGASGTTWSHHLDPATLVALAVELYGRAGVVHVVGVGVASLEIGERLSPLVEQAVDVAIETIARIIAEADASAPGPVSAALDA